MGKHQFAPKLYYELSLDHLVPQDHLLRQISAIDFTFVYPVARPYYSRTGTAEDVGNMVAFLASERASLVTGQTISVSGGYTMI